MFLDQEIQKKVKYKLGVFRKEEFSEADLQKITDIFISNLNPRGEVINTNLLELKKLRKLKCLDLKGFELTDDVLQVIHSFPDLNQLKLYSCKAHGIIKLNVETLKTLICDNCRINDFSEIVLPESVLIVDGGVVDISKFHYINFLKELSIKKSEIINSIFLEKMKGLNSLNVDGSTLDFENALEMLKQRKVKISNESEYHHLI